MICEDIFDSDVESRKAAIIDSDNPDIHLIRTPGKTIPYGSNKGDYLCYLFVYLNLTGGVPIRRSPNEYYYSALEGELKYLRSLGIKTNNQTFRMKAIENLISDIAKHEDRRIIEVWYKKVLEMREALKEREDTLFFAFKAVSYANGSAEQHRLVSDWFEKYDGGLNA